MSTQTFGRPSRVATALLSRLTLIVASLLLARPAFAAPSQPTADTTATTATTSRYEIVFSAKNGAPTRWQYRESGRGEGREQGRGQVDLIDTKLVTQAGPRPLDLLLPGLDLSSAVLTQEHRREPSADIVVARWTTDTFVAVRTLTLPHEGLVSTVRVDLTNRSDVPMSLADGTRGPGLVWAAGLGFSPDRSPTRVEEMSSYVQPFYFDEDGLSTEDVETEAEPLERSASMAWAGLHRHYFAVALWPEDGGKWASLRASVDPRALAVDGGVAEGERRFYPTLALQLAPTTVAPGQTQTWSYKLFLGPKDRAALARVQPGLDGLTYQHLWGWMAALCIGLEGLLGLVQALFGNWGLSIIALALALRAIIWPISRYGVRHQKAAQARQAEFNERSAAIKVQYKDQPDVKDEKILELYKEVGVSPVGQLKGCLPMLIQIPILIGLYHVLSSTWVLRGVPFLWIEDLTLADRLFSWGVQLPWLGAHFNLLPVLMFAAQVYIAVTLEPTGKKTDGEGAEVKRKTNKSILLTPFIMLVLFYPFPAGCMLYWTVANVSQAMEMLVGKLLKGRRSASAVG